MVYITRRKKKGKYYLYLEKSARIDGKPRRVWQKYLGPEEKIKEITFNGLLTKLTKDIDVQCIEFGISAALWQIAQKLNLSGIIDSITEKTRDQGLTIGEYITIASINRCVAPCSKSKIGKWFEKDWLSTRFDIEPKILNAQTYWNHFQYLNKEKIEEIETAINRVVVEKFRLNLDSLFYDPTNFFTFSGTNDENGLLQFGHSKENRNRNRLVNYSLLCARESGVPLMHETYSGNIQDAKKFKEVPKKIAKRLRALGRNPNRITLVFDKGNHSKEAFDAIERMGFGYIVSIRNSTQKDLLHISRIKFTKMVLSATNKSIEYFKTTREIYGVNKDVYVVLDPKKHEKHSFIFNGKIDDKVSEIKEFFKNRLNIKKWRKKEAVEEKVKSIIGRKPYKNVIIYKLSGKYANLKLKIEVDEKTRKQHLETLGRTILQTNRMDWPPETIIWGYREQYIVEHAFRRMKSPTSIAIRPMYHYSDVCIRVHVFVCVISLLLLSLLRLNLAEHSILIGYEELLEGLKPIHAIRINSSPKSKTLWRITDPGGISSKLIKKLRLKTLIK